MFTCDDGDGGNSIVINSVHGRKGSVRELAVTFGILWFVRHFA